MLTYVKQMLPTDIERLILEFHDEYDVSTKRFHMNLVFKSAFKLYRVQNNFDYVIETDEHWYVLLHFLNMFDKRLMKIIHNNTCYSSLWTGVVPWD